MAGSAILARPGLMGPLALRAYAGGNQAVRDMLAAAMHVHVEHNVFKRIGEIEADLPRNVPLQGDMPAPSMVIDEGVNTYLMIDEGGGAVSVYLLPAIGRPAPIRLGWFEKKQCHLVPDRLFVDLGEDGQQSGQVDAAVRQVFGSLDLLLSLMAEPRLIKTTPIPRQQRRAAERVIGRPAPAVWHSISWTVGEETCPKVASGDDNHRMPLHFCRAHWMKVPRQTRNSVLRHGGAGHGHYVWRRHSWKGHPDFGTRLGHYNPKIDAEGASAAQIAAVKQQAMDAAKAASIAAWQGQRRMGNG